MRARPDRPSPRTEAVSFFFGIGFMAVLLAYVLLPLYAEARRTDKNTTSILL
jgi:hypothetical protein